MVGSKLYGANAKMLLHTVDHRTIFAEESQLSCVEIGVLAVPKLGFGYGNGLEAKLLNTELTVAADDLDMIVHHGSAWVCNSHTYAHRVGVGTKACALELNIDPLVVFGGYVERIASEIFLSIGGHQMHIAVDAAARIPTGVLRLARVSHHGNHVLFAHLEELGHIDAETNIAIISLPSELTIDIDVAHIHHALEFEHQTSASQTVGWGKVESIPAFAHLLETASTETRAHVGTHVAIIGSLIGRRLDPRLRNLKIVREIDLLPLTIVIANILSTNKVAPFKEPTVVQENLASLHSILLSMGPVGHQEGDQGHKCPCH